MCRKLDFDRSHSSKNLALKPTTASCAVTYIATYLRPALVLHVYAHGKEAFDELPTNCPTLSDLTNFIKCVIRHQANSPQFCDITLHHCIHLPLFIKLSSVVNGDVSVLGRYHKRRELSRPGEYFVNYVQDTFVQQILLCNTLMESVTVTNSSLAHKLVAWILFHTEYTVLDCQQ